MKPETFLLPISDREPLAWIVREQRTAFPEHRRREAEALAIGDRLLLYTTRGCFRNPTRDRGRLIGTARVESTAQPLSKAIRFRERSYPIGIDVSIESLAKRGEGVELAPLVPSLESFPDPSSWSARMRRALVPITDADAERLSVVLEEDTLPYDAAAPSYEL